MKERIEVSIIPVGKLWDVELAILREAGAGIIRTPISKDRGVVPYFQTSVDARKAADNKVAEIKAQRKQERERQEKTITYEVEI